MKKLRYFFIFIIGALFYTVSYSQLISIPYFCGFEDTTENSNWVLNYGPQAYLCEDQWIVGNGARSEGERGLYISNDGYSALYGTNPNIVVAYRQIMVPQTITYDISFDWKSTGKENTSDLYVLLLQSSVAVPESNPNSSTVPNVVKQYKRAQLSNSSDWQNFSFTETLRVNQTYSLVFVWTNNNRDTTLVNPIGACIDNIQIASTMCAKPYSFDIDVSCDTTWLSWRGTSTEYELEYKTRGNMKWNKLGILQNTNTYITGLNEGIYDFRIRGICQNDTSAYLTNNSVIIFCPENHCINYVTLDDDKIVQGYYGKSGPPNTMGIIDFGPENVLSRHTVNWVQDEYDPRTKNLLRTIPSGSFASVRLGNWNTGYETESLHYSYTVDSTASILLMQYAVVLQHPIPTSGHSEKQRPMFLLEIYDQNNNLIDPTCGRADFYSDEVKPGSGWHEGVAGLNYVVVWKEWTTIGLNLDNYIGQTLSIRLTTSDCTLGGHYGYAYFTLGCTSAEIETNSCGEASEMTISAPEGFNYTWTNPNYPDSVWTTREIEIPATDTTTYYCDVCFKENPGCCFQLSTQVYPRFPIADFDYRYSAENCRNIIRFNNMSHIMTRYDDNEVHTNEPCDAYFWDFGKYGNSSMENPEIYCDNGGDTLNVTLSAYLSDRMCESSVNMQIIVPAISQSVDTIYDEICYGEVYFFGRYYIMQSGIYADTVSSIVTGCDSITVLNLTVHPQYDIPAVVDTICYGEEYFWIDKFYSQTDTIETWLSSEYGCDSIVTLHLYVHDEILFDVITTDVLNGPNSGRIEIENVSIPDYTYSLNGIMNASLVNLPGGIYTVVVYNEYGCASEPKEVKIIQDCLEVEFRDIPRICADESYFEINYTITEGFPTTYDVLFSNAAKKAGFSDLLSQPADETPINISLPVGVIPDFYDMDIVFEDVLCEPLHNTFSFLVRYPSSILTQKWNDVIAILDLYKDEDFDIFQWYKDQELLDGNNLPYLYIDNGELDFGAEYYVSIKRKGDSIAIPSCPIIPEFQLEAGIEEVLNSIVTYENDKVYLNLDQPSNVLVYDILGRNQKFIQFKAGMKQLLHIADYPGFYVISIKQADGNQYSFKILMK